MRKASTKSLPKQEAKHLLLVTALQREMAVDHMLLLYLIARQVLMLGDTSILEFGAMILLQEPVMVTRLLWSWERLTILHVERAPQKKLNLVFN
jgi:hypothetical protein